MGHSEVDEVQTYQSKAWSSILHFSGLSDMLLNRGQSPYTGFEININAFDHMEFCLVINLTMGGNWADIWPPIVATRYVSFATTLKYPVASTCYPQRKLIFNTGISLLTVLVEPYVRVDSL